MRQVKKIKDKSMKWMMIWLCVFLSLLFIAILLYTSHNPAPPEKNAVVALYSDLGT